MLEKMFTLNDNQIDLYNLKFINEGIKQHASDKFDYVKYRQAIKSLNDMKMDTLTAMTSTITTAQTMGVSTSDIISSAEQFITILQKEEEKFKDALSNQKDLKIEKKKHELEKIQKDIEHAKIKVEELNRSIHKWEEEIIQFQDEIISNQSKLDSKGLSFNSSLAFLVEAVQQDIKQLKDIKLN
ncbi:MAG: hypothetical protein M3Q56_11465 [Bacteroidota bacterium]|nr:hypothetical protein [Bacteroidota bacterium]